MENQKWQKLGFFFGSSTGNTEAIAYKIAEKLEEMTEEGIIEVHNIGASSPEQILKYDKIIMGIPTWNTGELQDDWDVFLPNIEKMDFKGKTVAMFGLGDQNGYGFNFLDALGILADEVIVSGAKMIGFWSTQHYEFEESLALDEGVFMGLGIDQDGQASMTDRRIDWWCEQIKEEFVL